MGRFIQDFLNIEISPGLGTPNENALMLKAKRGQLLGSSPTFLSGTHLFGAKSLDFKADCGEFHLGET